MLLISLRLLQPCEFRKKSFHLVRSTRSYSFCKDHTHLSLSIYNFYYLLSLLRYVTARFPDVGRKVEEFLGARRQTRVKTHLTRLHETLHDAHRERI